MMIFFDIDDTLLAHSEAEKQGARLFLKHFSDFLVYSEEEFCTLWNSMTEKYFSSFLSGKISFTQQRRLRIKEIFQNCSPDLSDEEADLHFGIYLQYYEKSWSLFDDVLPCLNSLKEFPLGIISNGNSEQQITKLKQTQIQDRFTTIIISDEIEIFKPNPEIFFEACKRAKVQPKDCIYVGDQLDIDALGSKAAGMRGIWLNRKRVPAYTLDLEMISSLNDLITKF